MKDQVILLCLGLIFLPSAAIAEIAIEITEPADGATIGYEFLVTANITSTYELQSVVAKVAELATDLQRQGNTEAWSGTVSLVGFQRGQYDLVVEATDAFDSSSSDIVSITLDLPPEIIVTEPVHYTIARPSLRIKAQCFDDDPAGCVSMEARTTVRLANGIDYIDELVSFPESLDGRHFGIYISGRDSAGQLSQEHHVLVFVDLNCRLTEIDNASGRILDFDADRILSLIDNPYGPQPRNKGELRLLERALGSDTILLDEVEVQDAALTPTGVLVYGSVEDINWDLFEISEGILTVLGKPAYRRNSVKQGEFTLYRRLSVGWVLRNLATGSQETVVDDSGLDGISYAANGDVVFVKDYNIFRFRDGSTENITQNSSESITFSEVITDGINVVYKKGEDPGSLWMYSQEGEHILIEQNQTFDHRANNGWVAFTKLGPSGVRQIWVRSPAGFVEQISYFPQEHSGIEFLAPIGEVMFFNPIIQERNSRRYLGIPGSTEQPELPEQIGGLWELGAFPVDWATYRDERWYVAMGGSITELTEENQSCNHPDGSDGSQDGGDGGSDGGDGTTDSNDCGGCNEISNPRNSRIVYLIAFLLLVRRRKSRRKTI